MCEPTWITCEAIWSLVLLISKIFTSMAYEELAVLCSGTSKQNFLTERTENYFSIWEKWIWIFSLVLKIWNVFLHKLYRNTWNILDNVDFGIDAERLLIREHQKKYHGMEYRTFLKAKIEYANLSLPMPGALRIKSDLDIFIDEDVGLEHIIEYFYQGMSLFAQS